MSNPIQDGMTEATRLTREGRLAEATALIQRALGDDTSGISFAPAGGFPTDAPGGAQDAGGTDRHTIDEAQRPTPPRPPGPFGPFLRRAPEPCRRSSARHRFTSRPPTGVSLGMPGAASEVEEEPSTDASTGGRFVSRSYTSQAGTRSYKLYIPSGYAGQAVPLVVMLHGCTQDPDDFAAGTRMNALAEEQTFLVAYPAQSKSANMSKCWNWFKEADQRRELGEPSILAGITREVTEEYGLAGGRVYVAGMSAGGAMAAIMGATYPDLYAAVGVHSGLAPGSARDLPSALSAMQGGQGRGALPRRDTSATRTMRSVPLIVFHGDCDTTVHPQNAEHLLANYGSAPETSASTASKQDEARESASSAKVRQGQVPGGYAYTRTTYEDADGHALTERWIVHGLGHAWSGGGRSGSYTDPNGPDASAEMLRFFDQQH